MDELHFLLDADVFKGLGSGAKLEVPHHVGSLEVVNPCTQLVKQNKLKIGNYS